MRQVGFHILRVGIAITFLWVGVLILKDPAGWSGYIQPWAQNLLPISAISVMIITAIFDIAVGALLLINMFTWIAAAGAVFHLITVLIVSGINQVTIRDVGILAGSLALFTDTIPLNLIPKFLKPKTSFNK